MKKKIIPFLVLAFSLGTGACSCSKDDKSSSSSVPSDEYVDLQTTDYAGAIALFRTSLKKVGGDTDQGFDFAPSPSAKRGDTDFGLSAYYYPEDSGESSSSSSSAEPENNLYGFDATLDGASFRANGLDALSAASLVTSSVIDNLNVSPSAGASELSETAIVNQCPEVYTVNDASDYREYFNLQKSLVLKQVVEGIVEKSYGVDSWQMPRKSYRSLEKEEKTLVDSLFTGEDSLVDKISSEYDALVDDMVSVHNKALAKGKESPLTIAKNELGSYRLIYSPDATTSARFLQGRVSASSLPTLAKLPINNDISAYFSAVSSYSAAMTFYFTESEWKSLSLNINSVAPEASLKKSETIDYANSLSTSTTKIPDVRLSSFHLIGEVTPYSGTSAKITLPDLSTYSELVMPTKA